MGIAVSPNGDVGVAGYLSHEFCVYEDDGRYKFSLDTNQGLNPGDSSHPCNLTVNADGIWYVTDESPFVKMYSSQGVYKDRWGTLSPDGKEGHCLSGLTMDANGHLLVGDWDRKFISRHRQDGSQIASFKVDMQPDFLAATSQDTIVVSNRCKAQIVDSKGHVLHILKLNGKQTMRPRGVCVCDDTIYVCDSSEISCFSVSAEYIGSITVKYRPYCVTIVKEQSKLFTTSRSNRTLVYKNTALTE